VIAATLALTAHSLRRIRPILIGIGILLAGFEFLLTQVAVYLMQRSAFGQLSALIPDFVRTSAGPAGLAFMSFSGIVTLGYFHPLVMAALVGLAITIASEPAAEVEMRFSDLTLARSLARRDAITRTLLVLAISGSLMLALMMLGTWIGLSCCTPADAERPAPRAIVSLAVSLAAVMLCWGGIALALAAGARRRAVAAGVAGVSAFAAYLLDYLGRAWEPAEAISAVSPFHYFEPMAVVTGSPPSLQDLAVLIGIGLSGIAIGYLVFTRRDI
jgi:hypothetical protein